MSNDCRVGNVRPSQLLWTYGPGAMIDLPNFSVMTMGLDSWRKDACTLINEPRLLAQVQRMCGPQVKYLMRPPVCKAEDEAPNSAESYVGVPVQMFPRWLRCVKCGILAPYDRGVFKLKTNFYRPERTRFVHEHCALASGSKPVDAVPVRFLVACRNGHVDEFPWRWFVHDGPSECKGTLRFSEQGAAVTPENLWVECTGCGRMKSLAQAFGPVGRRSLPACRGHHPHLGYDEGCYETCNEPLRPILLGATNSWFPVTLSVLAIPTQESELAQLVEDNWEALSVVGEEKDLNFLFMVWKSTNERGELRKFGVAAVWAALQKFRAAKEAKKKEVTSEDLKSPEWDELTCGKAIRKTANFTCREGAVPASFSNVLHKVVLLERLRKVNALVGFTRIEARDEFAEEGIAPARLCRGKPEFVPACEVFGEGIFLQFREEVVAKWEASTPVKVQEKNLKSDYGAWRTSRNLDALKGFPGVRYYLLHTIAHLLIREFSLECGYNAASLQERIYAQPGEKPMAGILIYTAASDSDGTLGGLVDLGKAEKLGAILRKALSRAKTCSSDPLCSEHANSKDISLHGAACHACAFVAETSCEVGNRYLDRSLVVPTYAIQDAAFFKDDIA